MRKAIAAYVVAAEVMADRFSAIVRTTGDLSEEDMRAAIAQARREGVAVPAFRSPRSLQILNGVYINGGQQ